LLKKGLKDFTLSKNMAKSILYVEDDEEYNECCRELLEEKGYIVFSYAKGKECLHDVQANSLKYDLAIIDLSLPDIGGEELVRDLKRINPKTPVFIISGYDYKPRGADRYFHKAIPISKFIEEVDSFLSEEYDFGEAF
jgi:DNA-binding response OmpR family regulator